MRGLLRPCDEVDDFLFAVAELPSGVEQVSDLVVDDGASRCVGCNCDAASTPELEHPLVAEVTKCAQDGVVVDLQDRGEVSCWGEPFARSTFAVGDGASDFACDLFVERCAVFQVHVDIEHGASYSSTIAKRTLRA
jgi:hypothetical protein